MCLCTSAFDVNRTVELCFDEITTVPTREEDSQTEQWLNEKSAKSMLAAETPPSLLFKGKQVANLRCWLGQKKEVGNTGLGNQPWN